MIDGSNKKGIAGLFMEAGRELIVPVGGGPGGPKDPKIFNVLEYIEQPWGLAMKLFPAQRFLVKLYYHLELDDVLPSEPDKQIVITDMLKTEVKYRLTEKQYLSYLFNEGRCNIGEQDHMRRELVLSIGRRAGKTTLSGIFASYEVYRLLNLYNPQAYYGLPNGNRIQIISVATDKDQAGLLFNEVASHMAKCEYFKPYIASNTQTFMNFRTPYDIERYGTEIRNMDGKYQSLNGKASVRVTFKGANGKGLRGAGNVVIILDEVAHFLEKGGTSADEVYAAVSPSAAAFSRKNPATGRPAIDPVTGKEAPVESRVILISSPLGKSGLFYNKFDLAMRGGLGADNIIAVQAPTWEINPTVPSSYYKEKYHSDPVKFMVEHGAEFSDQVRGWIERESDLQACIKPALRPKMAAPPKMPHQMGIDVGLIGDGTALAITHIEKEEIVLDYHEVWYAGVDWRDSNPHLKDWTTDYAKGLTTVERLDFDAIAEWIEKMTRKFYITAGLFDRFSGIPLEQALIKKGLRQFKSEFFTRDQTSKMFQAVKLLMYDNRLALYDYPIPEQAKLGSKHSPLISELLTLQATQISKNIISVEAPKKEGAHDDMSDALIRSIWLSHEAMVNQKHTSFGLAGYRPQVSTGMTPQAYQLARAMQHGIADRTIIRRFRR